MKYLSKTLIVAIVFSLGFVGFSSNADARNWRQNSRQFQRGFNRGYRQTRNHYRRGYNNFYRGHNRGFNNRGFNRGFRYNRPGIYFGNGRSGFYYGF